MTASSATRSTKLKRARLTKLRDSDDTEFLYTYDLSDNFEHRIEVLDLFEASAGSRLPVFLGGKLRTPQEDVRRSPGFEMFLETINHPTHEDYDHLVDS